MPQVHAPKLTKLVTEVFRAREAPLETAQIVARSLVGANLRGHDSHGVMRVPRYLDFIEDGRIVPEALPLVRHQSGATAIVDGRWGFGQVGADAACRVAAELAELQGVGTVALHDVMHIGRLGEYATALAAKGYAALVLTSNGGPENATAPFGGRDRIFGTNPLAFAAPGARLDTPLLVDFATSATAEGKLALARSLGERIEPGTLLDRDGRPTTAPGSFYAGGALLPFGAHKGYGLMVMVEIMARILTGYPSPAGPSYVRGAGNATLVIAWDIQRFVGRNAFVVEMRRLIRAIKASRPGMGGSEVLFPGEPEARTLAERRKVGVPVPDALWEELQTLAGRTARGACHGTPAESSRPPGNGRGRSYVRGIRSLGKG